jgi:hypothetical protein
MSTGSFSTWSMKSLVAAVAGLITLIVVFAVARERGFVDSATGARLVAVGLGLMFVVIGNALPKLVRPIGMHWRDPAAVLSAERFAGRVFVVAGLVFAALWLLAPITHVMFTSALVGLGAFALVAVSQIRLLLSGQSSEQHTQASDSAAAREVVQKRFAVFHLLHGLLWACAMFLADSIWGDGAALWMVVGFVVASGALTSVQVTAHRALRRSYSRIC